MIAVCSLFRDNASDIQRCFADRAAWEYPHDELLHVCVEGDSVDGTYEALCAMKSRHRMVVSQYHCGRPRHPSVIEPERMSVLGRTSNVCLELALAQRPTHVLWLDSDVSTQPALLPVLLGTGRDVIAPMFFFERSVFFRDTWGYRSKSGEFTNRPPFCKEYKRDRPFEVVSVGLPLIRTAVLDAGARFTEEEEMVGLCKNIKALGYPIFCHPHARVTHPRMGIEIPPQYERNY